MHFWNIKALKWDLVHGKMDDADALRYFLWSSASLWFLMTIGMDLSGLFQTPQPAVWRWLFSGLGFVVFFIGLSYCLKANGGPQGHQFFLRFFSLGLVFALRFVAFYIPVALAICAIISCFLLLHIPSLSARSIVSWLDLLLPPLLIIAFFFRLSQHIKDVAVRFDPTLSHLENPYVEPALVVEETAGSDNSKGERP